MKKIFSSLLLLSTILGSSVACSALSAGPDKEGGDGDSDADPDVTGKLPDGSDASAALPARIRRLTNAEYNAAVKALIGTTLQPADDFPPDTRQHGFSVNEAQRVDPVLARKLDAAAIALASEVVTRLDEFAPCSSGDYGACAGDFIYAFAQKAYRRPISEDEALALAALFQAGATDADYAAGVHQVVRGILQSPGFLYITEIGDGSQTGTVRMTPHETASSMAFFLTGGPPDDALLAAAAGGNLATAEGRASEARRLLSTEGGSSRAVRIVREWLGIDRIVATAKDANIYPAYEGLRAAMNDESNAFIRETLVSSSGSVEELLGAPWTIASGELAALYGAAGDGRIDVPDRPGLLNRGAFLSVYAHAHETSPVLRGTAILRRLGCIDIEIPTTLDAEIIPPIPDPTQTTRERFSVHSQDGACAQCHDLIDPLGFTFEQFDGMGAFRAEENGKPIDSSGNVALRQDFDATYSSSTDLATALSTSASVRECFARQVFRASAAEGTGIEESEAAFVTAWSGIGEDAQKSLIEILVQFAASDLSVFRSEP